MVMGTGKTWAKVCPGCGQHNSVHALWCGGCEQMLPITTMVELENPEPEGKAGGEGASDSGTTTSEEHSVEQASELAVSAPSPPEHTVGEADVETDNQPDGNEITSSAPSHDEEHDDYALIPADPRRGGCLSLWLVGVTVANAAGIIVSLLEGTFHLIACGLGLVNILFASALWRMKRFGVYGLAGSFGLTIILGLVVQDLYTIASGVVPMILLIVLVQPVWDELE